MNAKPLLRREGVTDTAREYRTPENPHLVIRFENPNPNLRKACELPPPSHQILATIETTETFHDIYTTMTISSPITNFEPNKFYKVWIIIYDNDTSNAKKLGTHHQLVWSPPRQ